MRFPAVVAAMVLLAGCTDGGGDAAGATGEPVAAGTGRLCIVVVDQAIRPVADVNLTIPMTDGTSRSAVTGEDGTACLDLAPGTYVVDARHLHGRFGSAQTTVTVEEGREVQAKVLLEALFTQEPFHDTLKFDGFIQCGYAISGVMSSLCVNDYTHFVGPYTCTECEHFFDSRSTNFALGPGWQTAIYELTWEPSAQGTSPEMSLIISFFPRDASHAFCRAAGPNPLLVRQQLGEECEGNQGGEPEQPPPEGMPNMHLFAATDPPEGQPASVAFSQRFTVFLNFFYYGMPPEGWSFLNGDPYPF